MSEKNMLPIWFFVGLLLTIVGLIVTATGVYYVLRPETRTALARLNPSLWWGMIVLVSGLLFLVVTLVRQRRS